MVAGRYEVAGGFMSTSTKVSADSSKDAPLAALEQAAFRSFPYSLFVADRMGRVVARNLEGERLIAAANLTGLDLTCCMLLGCRSPDSVLAEACLTELTNNHGSALPEVRVDVPTLDGVRAMWVAAAPLHDADDSPYIVLQLRPGLAQDRRRRTDPHWMTGPRLRISVLGSMIVEAAEGEIGGEWLDQRTGQLLKYLIAERHRS